MAEISRLKKKVEESKRIPDRPRKRRKLSKDNASNLVSSGSEEPVLKEGSLHLSASRDSSAGGNRSRSPPEYIPSSDAEENVPEMQSMSFFVSVQLITQIHLTTTGYVQWIKMLSARYAPSW